MTQTLNHGAARLSTRRDAYDGALPEAVDPNEIRRLSRLRPAISSAHIAMEWLLIGACTFVCSRFWHPLLYLFAVAFIGARQHALIVLAHEAAHFRLFQNRALNDWCGELFLAWPFVFFTMQAYRRNHFPHHRHTNTERDPDWIRKQGPEWHFPITKTQLAWMLFLDAIGVGFIKFVVTASRLPKSRESDSDSKRNRLFGAARLIFLVAGAAILTVMHAWKGFLLFWLTPYVTWMQLIFHVRSIAEHFAIRDRTGVYAQTRTVIPSWFDRVFVLPKNANFHLEHHMFPSVPFYRLPELHRLLMTRPTFRDSVHLTHGYVGVLRECVTVGVVNVWTN